MQQVELKSHDDICVYISPHPEGNVIFSTRLFRENHLSRYIFYFKKGVNNLLFLRII